MPFTLGKMGAGSEDARGDVNVFYIDAFERARQRKLHGATL